MSHDHMFEDPNELWETFNNPETSMLEKAFILFRLARSASMRKNFKEEKLLLESSIDILEALPVSDEVTASIVYHKRMLASTLCYNFEYNDQAVAVLDSAEKLLRPELMTEDKLREAQEYYTDRGFIMGSSRMYEGAVLAFQQAEKFASDLSDEIRLPWIQEFLALSYLEAGMLEEAEATANRARAYYLESDRTVDVVDVDAIIGRIWLKAGKAIQARNLLIEVRNAERALRGTSSVRNKMHLGFAELACGEVAKAEKLLLKVRRLNYNSKSGNYEFAFEAGAKLVEIYEASNRKHLADQIRAEDQAVNSRVKGYDDTNDKTNEAEEHYNAGEIDLALIVNSEDIQKRSDLGDIKGRQKAICNRMKYLSAKDDYESVVVLWNQLSEESIDVQEEFALPIKNFAMHALHKTGRVKEALKLFKKLDSDSRLEYSAQERAYAYENRARIELDKNHKGAATRYFNDAINTHLKAGNTARALKVSEIVLEITKTKPKEDPREKGF